MSDHISGPRALAEPIADITDLYAFPSPDRPGHLVLVLNTLPFAPPTARFSDALIYRFRLRELDRNRARSDPARSHVDDDELVIDCVFSHRGDGTAASSRARAPSERRHGHLRRRTTSRAARATASGSSPGPRWDPFIMDAPAALKTIATGELAFTDPGSIYLDGKNVLSLVVEIDCAAVLGRHGARRRRRGDPDPRQAQRPASRRVGRPEVKNMMLGAEAVRPG